MTPARAHITLEQEAGIKHGGYYLRGYHDTGPEQNSGSGNIRINFLQQVTRDLRAGKLH